jgi:hypothetical protein
MTPEDHRQLAERCIRLAKTSSKPSVAVYLTALAADYLELAELTIKVRRPAAAIFCRHVRCQVAALKNMRNQAISK